MFTFTLNDDEAVILHGIIESFFDETHTEIRHTDDRQYREKLVHQEGLAKRLLDELETAGVITAVV